LFFASAAVGIEPWFVYPEKLKTFYGNPCPAALLLTFFVV